MYYPLLRARQFELIALRELASERIIQGLVMPIIEPVKESYSNFFLAEKIFKETGQSAFLIMNPLVGEKAGDDFHYTHILNQIDNPNIRASFYFRNNSEYISEAINRHNLDDCMIICPSDTDPDSKTFVQLVSNRKVTSVCVESPERNRSLHRFLKSLKKNYIRLDDLFEKQNNNSAYLEIQEHRFSEEHLYYKDEGFTGFGDYTVLPSEYIDGGSTPRAVVIHLTYLRGNSEIWIRHFTSITNDSVANVQGKFSEAAHKAVTFCRNSNHTNSAIQELETYYDSEHYPGLGTIKKISIKNHLLVVSDYLRNI